MQSLSQYNETNELDSILLLLSLYNRFGVNWESWRKICSQRQSHQNQQYSRNASKIVNDRSMAWLYFNRSITFLGFLS